jgi:amino acid adenylation domain-containing protein
VKKRKMDNKAGLSEAKKELLSKWLKGKTRGQERIPQRPAGMESSPLSYSQQRLWFLDQFEPGNAFYNLPVAVQLTGQLDQAALSRTLDEIVRRHEALRTSFVGAEGSAVQVVAPVQELALPLADLSDLPSAEAKAKAQWIVQDEAQGAFDLATGPLIRAKLIRLSESEHIFVLTLHHIVSDGWSMGVLVQEVAALYSAYVQQQASPLPDLAIQYADYAYWQRQWLQGETVAEQLDYWVKQLGGSPTLLALPTDRPHPIVQSYRGATVDWSLSADITTRLNDRNRIGGNTLFMSLMATFSILLSRYSGQSDICIGTPVANRNRSEMESLIGFFVNTLVVRTHVDGKDSYARHLDQVRSTMLDAYAHQNVPFEQLVEVLKPERHTSHSPLFQVMLVLQNTPMDRLELPGLTLQGMRSGHNSAKFDLTLTITEGEQQLNGTFEYNTDLFDAATIERMAGHFTNLLEAIVANPETQIDHLEILGEAERHQLLVDWNSPESSPSTGSNLQELFERQALRRAQAIAIVCDDQRLTYGELNSRANQLAHYLRGQGIQTGDLVGLCVERSLEMIVGVLGILKAGAAYVPLDPTYPQERLHIMLDDARPKLIITQQSMQQRLEWPAVPLLSLDCDWERIATQATSNPENRTTGSDLAYVIYTSGSTGKPKGALLTHGNVLRLFSATEEQFDFNERDVWSMFHSFAFDFSVWEIWGALLYGGTLVIVPQDTARSPEQFHALLVKEQITILNQTPSAFQQLIAADAAANRLSVLALRKVIFGGEALNTAALAPWYDAHGDEQPQLINMYGITETTVHVTYQALPASTSLNAVGRPIRDLAAYILDNAQNPVPIGVAGELHIAGAGLARGYLNRPELTAEKFIPNPFGGMRGARMYKTGDLARYLPDGNIEYLGRIDQQVKIRGFRIELGEIEAALMAQAEVREAIVLAREDEPGDKRLVAYLVAQEGVDARALEPATLRTILLQTLPDYMVPAHFMLLERLPLTSNGKIDRKSLPIPERTRSEAGYVAPRTSTEDVIAEIWAEVLKLDKVGVHDNFFALGGHSLMATQVNSQIKARIKADLPLRTLFEEPTIAQLALKLGAQQIGVAQAPGIVPVTREQALPLSFSQQRQWFLDQFEPGTAAYNIPIAVKLQGKLDTDALARTLNEIVRRHETLRTTFVAVDGVPQQIIAAHCTLALPTIDLSAYDPEERSRKAQALAHQEAGTGFDLANDTLIRARLIRLAPQEHVFLLTVHHIIADGWSMGVLIQEITVLYPAYVQGLASPLPELAVQYVDFACWQQRWLTGAVLQQHLSYWKQQLADAPELLTLPTDYPRPPVQSHRGARHVLTVDSVTNRRLQAISQQTNATLFMTLHAAFGILLARYAAQNDICIGTFIANRNRAETEPLIGFFVNTLVLRTRIDSSIRFTDLLQQVRSQTLDAYVHQDVPFEYLLDAIKPNRNPGYTPLFQAMLVLQNAPKGRVQLPELTLEPVMAGEVTAKFDLMLECTESAEQELHCAFDYCADLFDAATIERLARHFTRLLESIAQDAEAQISELDMLEEGEREQLLGTWNDTTQTYPTDKTLHQLFEEQAERTPQAIAVEQGEHSLSYAELNRRANQLAHHLRHQGAGTDQLIGLCIARSLDMIIGLMAIHKAGAAYVPLDPSHPNERLAVIIEDAQPQLILTQALLHDKIAHVIGDSGTPILKLDTDSQRWKEEPTSNPAHNNTAQNLAYVIYTSGSTGKPKGVLNTHRNVVQHSSSHSAQCRIRPDDRLLQFAALSFDASAEEIFPALTSGATLVLRPVEFLGVGPAWTDYLAAHRITILDLPTAFWHEWTQALSRSPTPLPTSLRLLIVGGEKAQREDLNAWKRLSGSQGLRWLNTYGPTETTIATTSYTADPEQEDQRDIPIGRPNANSQLYLLDSDLQPAPIGVIAELHIAGAGLARGYLMQPDITADKFIPNPFSSTPGARMYKSGDLARYRADGNIEYIGRIDDQIKLRGFRIELGEIESALTAIPGIKDSIVLAREDQPGDKRLVAYIVAEERNQTGNNAGTEDHNEPEIPDPTTLRNTLAQTLPDYMLPAHYVLLAQLPINSNGKVDRKALPAPDTSRNAIGNESSYVAPRTEAEQTLATLWAEVLQCHQVGIHDNFFTLGGHSLLAVVLLERMRQAGYRIDIRAFFSAPTVAAQAAHAAQASNDPRPVTPDIQIPPNRIPAASETISPDMLSLVTLTPGEIATIVAHVPGGAANIQDIYPLAPLQEGILFHHLLGQGGDLYLMPTLLGFDSKAQLDAFLPALQRVIDRHDILRTAVHWEDLNEPVQIVWRQAQVKIEHQQLDPAQGDIATQLMTRYDPQHYRLDLRHAPLLHGFTAEDPSNHRWLLLIMAHHLICDHATGEILIEEIHTILQGQEAHLPKAQPFRNFVAQARLGISREEHVAFFKDMLGDVDEPTHPYGLSDVHGSSNGIDQAKHAITPELGIRLRTQARQQGVSVASLAHLAWAQVLAKVSGRQDVVFGTLLIGRVDAGTAADRVLGMFINTLPLRLQVGEQGTAQSVQDTHRKLIQLLRHEHAPLSLAQRASGVVAPTPLFSSLLNYRHTRRHPQSVAPAGKTGQAGQTAQAENLHGMHMLGGSEFTNYPFYLSMDDFGDGFELEAQTNGPVAAAKVCRYMHTALERLVQTLESAPHSPINRIDILPQEERRQLLLDWNDTHTNYPQDKTIQQLFEEQADKTPDAIALVYQDQQLTYGELNGKANQLAQYLRKQGVGPDTLVGICMERSLEMIVGLLGILKAGGAYLPLDPTYPQERLNTMLDDARPQVLLTQSNLLDRIETAEIEKTEIKTAEITILCLDTQTDHLTPFPSSNPACVTTAQHLAYVNYTSGSTGKPKGVGIPQQAVVRLVRNTDYAVFDHQQRYLQCAPISFDAATFEIWGALLNGGQLIVLEAGHFSADHLADALLKHRITTLWLTAALFNHMVDEKLDALCTVHHVLAGGDVLSPRHVNRFIEAAQGKARLTNGYGPTENTTFTCCHPINEPIPAHSTVALGRPIANGSVYILDTTLQPVPVGVAGELHAAGDGLARAYLNRPDITAEKFIPNPFATTPGARLYKTGDLARYLPDGNIEYLGRIDHQVKVRGYRIELGEIEAVLTALPEVREAIVLAREDEPGDKRLVAYLVVREEIEAGTWEPAALRTSLLQTLPDYMVPAHFVLLEQLPLTPNGKVDRKALPAPEKTRSEVGYVAPRTATEEAIAAIWAEVLKLDKVGVHDNFFALGGHSLMAVQILSRISREMSVNIPVAIVFECQTVSLMSSYVDEINFAKEAAMQMNDVPEGSTRVWI